MVEYVIHAVTKPAAIHILHWFYIFIQQHNTYNTIQYNTIQYNTIQYNTIQYNTIQYNTKQYNTKNYNIYIYIYIYVIYSIAESMEYLVKC